MDHTPQFGEPLEKYTERPGAYAVIIKDGALLALAVDDEVHLPGGGIDPGESEKQALIREVREEAGCEIAELRLVGRANQFIAESALGPLNKLGVFYRAEVASQDTTRITEMDHHITWVPLDQVNTTLNTEYQRWAVQQALKNK